MCATVGMADGCGRLTVFRRVALPLSAPAWRAWYSSPVAIIVLFFVAERFLTAGRRQVISHQRKTSSEALSGTRRGPLAFGRPPNEIKARTRRLCDSGSCLTVWLR